VEAASPSPRSNALPGSSGAPITAMEGGWVRGPLWVAAIQSALLSVLLPIAAGYYASAAINSFTTLLLLAAIYYGDPQRRAFRFFLNATCASTLFSLWHSVFVVGAPGATIVYYTPLILLGAAHMLSARAAVFWALPCIALSVASEFVPTTARMDPSPMVAIITESGLILTVLAYAVSLRRAYDRKAVELGRLASTDALTGLANRLELQLALRQALGRAQRFGRRGAVVFIDLDGLKNVNDLHGHDAGDALLRVQAGRLRALTRGIDVAARVGGDEFVMLLSEFEDPKGAEVFARKALAVLSAPVQLGGARLEAGASIGIAEFPSHADGVDALLSRADEAMYAAKRAGGGRIHRAFEHGFAEVI
jgi:diguanylate cyclase (GGDEF)-like protein